MSLCQFRNAQRKSISKTNMQDAIAPTKSAPSVVFKFKLRVKEAIRKAGDGTEEASSRIIHTLAVLSGRPSAVHRSDISFQHMMEGIADRCMVNAWMAGELN